MRSRTLYVNVSGIGSAVHEAAEVFLVPVRTVLRIVVTTVLSACFVFGFVFAFFGKDAQYAFTDDEVAAARYIYAVGGPDSLLIEGTRNYPGIADAAVDAAIEALLKATSREDFVAAVRALDRLLVSGIYIIPFYDAGGQWVARWNNIGRPDAQPLTGFETTTLWRNK